MAKNAITFPKYGHEFYITELEAGKPIWTSRISKELGRYQSGKCINLI